MHSTEGRQWFRRGEWRATHGWPSVAGWIAAALIAVAAHAQAPQPAAGSTIETAIVLPHIADELHGVAAEHAYIAAHYPTWHIERQALIGHNGRHYDLLSMVEPDGTKATIYFDITDWFGK